MKKIELSERQKELLKENLTEEEYLRLIKIQDEEDFLEELDLFVIGYMGDNYAETKESRILQKVYDEIAYGKQ